MAEELTPDVLELAQEVSVAMRRGAEQALAEVAAGIAPEEGTAQRGIRAIDELMEGRRPNRIGTTI